jgi:5-(carboxyamino)imidazole ribonucleotide synthase
VHSQFDQQVRTLCGLPLGDTRLISPVVMMNLLGDLWEKEAPHWQKLFQHPQLKLHLYGKKAARAGRKMGHINALGVDTQRALAVLQVLRQDWQWPQ